MRDLEEVSYETRKTQYIYTRVIRVQNYEENLTQFQIGGDQGQN